jgi:hypothetical protein
MTLRQIAEESAKLVAERPETADMELIGIGVNDNGDFNGMRYSVDLDHQLAGFTGDKRTSYAWGMSVCIEDGAEAAMNGNVWVGVGRGTYKKVEEDSPA